MIRRLQRVGIEVGATALAVVPIVAAFVRSVTSHWLPIGDSALMEIRARDVFSTGHFPTLGTWSSASQSAGKDLNHPGPLLFDLLAVPVRVFGGPVGVALGITLINALAVVGVAIVAHRVGGRAVCLVGVMVAATLSWTLGSELLISPWNPHPLILPCLLFLLLGSGVAAGDLILFPWMLGVGSLCLQTHLGYVYLVPSVSVVALLAAAVVYRRRWRTDPACRSSDVRRVTRLGLTSLALLIVLWAQPLWEQFTGRGEGNLSRLVGSTGGDEPTIGLSLGLRILGGVVALPPWWGRPSFMDTVPFTPLAPDGSAPDPAGLAGVGAAVAGLLVVVALLAACVVVAARRLDRPALVAAALAGVTLVVATTTFVVAPVGTIGLAAHQMRWVWAIGAFVAFALLTSVVRLARVADVRPLQWATVAVVALLAVLNIPAHVHRDGPSASAPEAYAPARELSRQIDDYDPGPGGVVFETSNLRFGEPYSTVVMSALQRNGIDFSVEDHGMIRQLGSARAFDGRAQTRLIMVEDRSALDVPRGATLVAHASPLDAAEVDELLAGERAQVAAIEARGLAMTPEGSAVVDSGALGVTVEEVDAAMVDAERLVAIGAVARLTRAGVLEIAPEDVALFQRMAELRADVDLRTVSVFAVPV